MQPIAAGGQPVMAIAAWQSQVGPALRLRTRRKQFNGSPATLNSTGSVQLIATTQAGEIGYIGEVGPYSSKDLVPAVRIVILSTCFRS